MSRPFRAFVISLATLAAATAPSGAAAQDQDTGRFDRRSMPDPPIDLVVGADRGLWVLDGGGGLARVADGRARRVLRSTGQNDARTGRSVVVDGLGRLVFASGDRVWRVAPDGRRSSVPLRRLTSRLAGELTRFVAGPDGSVWFGTPDGFVGRLATTGRVRRWRVPNGMLGYPQDPPLRSLAVAADGSIWFTVGTHLGRISDDGSFAPALGIPSDRGPLQLGLLSRGADEAIWTSLDERPSLARIGLDGSATLGQRVSDRPLVYTAMAPGASDGVWDVSGYPAESVGGTSLDSIGLSRWDGSLARADLLPRSSRQGGTLSARTFGLVSGLDGRMWFTERDYSAINAYTPAGGVGPVRRGRAHIVRAEREGRRVRAELGCVGPTGSYCVGTLRVRLAGRPVGRSVGYAIAAGPAAVRSRAARTLPLPVTARRSRARLVVAGTPGRRGVPQRRRG